MASPFQTLSEFLENPFGKGKYALDTDYEAKYISFRNSNKITLQSVLESGGNYFLHIQVPSESQEGVKYDVVLQFFTDKESVKVEMTLKNYFIKFFSNSPSFIYRFAALYHREGFLIEALQSKLGKETLDNLPTQTNAELKMEYDKSIYFACRFLTENKFTTLNKVGIVFRKTTNAAAFFSKISTFDDIKTDTDISKLEKSITKMTDKKFGAGAEIAKKRHEVNKISGEAKRIKPIEKKAPVQKKTSQPPKQKIKAKTSTFKK